MSAAPASLPELRDEVRLLRDPGGSSHAGEAVLHDPVRDSYFSLGPEALQLLSLWSAASTPAELAARAEAVYGRRVEEQEAFELARALSNWQLTVEQPGGWRGLAARRPREGAGRWLLHNYLFFKIPLIRPGEFLVRTLPFVRPLASGPAVAVWTWLVVTGLYLVSRQWSGVIEDLRRQMTFGGAATFAVTLFLAKIFHELGHAYVAAAMGVRVRSMGLAFMLMTPMLYTDVTDAWRLPSRRQRMAIDLAGVAVEFALAGVAMMFWALLPPGDGRDVALVVATSALAMSVMVNLSPFMRFDGYYVFADMIGVRNLQPRAFALTRWRLREALFALGEPAPDRLRGGLRALVIAYGATTMVYRLALFLGIALVVYHMFFKLLGVALFLVEIVFFVAAPIWRELKVWWAMRAKIARHPRAWMSAAVAASLVALAVTPWSGSVRAPAVLEPARYARLFPAGAGEIREVRVRRGQAVAADEVLLTLASPRLEKELDVALAKLRLVEERMDRRMGDARDYSQTISLEKDRLSLIEKRDALINEIDALAVRAPIAGVVVDLDPSLSVGRLVSRKDELGLVVAGADAVIRGYAPQDDLWRFAPGAKARFIPDDPHAASVGAVFASAAPTAAASIDIPQLAETFGGPLRVAPQHGHDAPPAPIDALRLVTLEPQGVALDTARAIRGVAVIEGEPQSLVAAFWRRGLKVLVQEFAR
jgi:putative peptide zinc metalloprotease protein